MLQNLIRYLLGVSYIKCANYSSSEAKKKPKFVKLNISFELDILDNLVMFLNAPAV